MVAQYYSKEVLNELAAKAREGNEDSFTKAYHSSINAIKKFVSKRDSRCDVDAISNEAFQKAIGHYDVSKGKNFINYAKLWALSEINLYHRTNHSKIENTVDYDLNKKSSSSNVLKTIGRYEKEVIVEKAMIVLDEREREILRGVFGFDGKSVPATRFSDKYNVSNERIAQLIDRGIKKIQPILERELSITNLSKKDDFYISKINNYLKIINEEPIPFGRSKIEHILCPLDSKEQKIFDYLANANRLSLHPKIKNNGKALPKAYLTADSIIDKFRNSNIDWLEEDSGEVSKYFTLSDEVKFEIFENIKWKTMPGSKKDLYLNALDSFSSEEGIYNLCKETGLDIKVAVKTRDEAYKFFKQFKHLEIKYNKLNRLKKERLENFGICNSYEEKIFNDINWKKLSGSKKSLYLKVIDSIQQVDGIEYLCNETGLERGAANKIKKEAQEFFKKYKS